MAYIEEKKSYYYISDPNTGTEEVQHLTFSEIAVLRRTRPGNKVFNMDKVLMSYKNFRRVFEIYNENLIRRTTNKFASILERVYKRYKIDQPLIPFIRSMTVEAYFEMIPEKYFRKMSFEKRIYMALVRSTINDEEKGLFFKQLRRIPEIKMKIANTIDSQIMVLVGYILAGSGISFFLITKVIPKLLLVNKDIHVDLSTSYTIMYLMWLIAAVIVLFRLGYERYKNSYIVAFVEKPVVGDLITGINFIDLLTIYLIGQFSNITTVMSMYNAMFPYIAEKENPGSRQTLIKRIMDDEQKAKFFTVDGLIVLDSIGEKGTNEIIKTVQEQSEAYAQSLDDKTKALSNIIQKTGLLLIATSVFGPILALLGIMTSIMDAIQHIRK